MTQPDILIRNTLEHMFPDLDFTRGDLEQTPERWVKALKELTTPEEFSFTTFPVASDEMVFCGPIPFVSLCAHHLLPFIGEGYVAYVPDLRMAGLSKLSRQVKYCAAGLSVQEQLTTDIVEALDKVLEPLGIAVQLKAEHTCQTIRGAKSSGTQTITTRVTGVFADHSRTAKAEFLDNIRSVQ